MVGFAFVCLTWLLLVSQLSLHISIVLMGCEDWNPGVLQLAHITRMEMPIDALFCLVGSVETGRGENSKYLREVKEEQDQS